MTTAIAREKAIKNLSRVGKIALIESLNPEWKDLAADWGKPMPLYNESSADLRK